MNALCGKLWCILFVFDYIIKDGYYDINCHLTQRENCAVLYKNLFGPLVRLFCHRN